MNGRHQSIGDICTYRIDAADKITYIGRNWTTFARENAAADACLPPVIYGSLLWDHIQGHETKHLYRLIVDKIRTTARPIQVSINCDAPDLKRHMRITLQPGPDGEVVFESEILGLEPRPVVTLFNADHPRKDELVRICSYCKKIDLGQDRWVETEAAVRRMELFKYTRLPQLTHTVCPTCYSKAMQELEAS